MKQGELISYDSWQDNLVPLLPADHTSAYFASGPVLDRVLHDPLFTHYEINFLKLASWIVSRKYLISATVGSSVGSQHRRVERQKREWKQSSFFRNREEENRRVNLDNWKILCLKVKQEVLEEHWGGCFGVGCVLLVCPVYRKRSF